MQGNAAALPPLWRLLMLGNTMWPKRLDSKPKEVANSTTTDSTKALGDVAEDLALRYLLGQGLSLVQRNYSTPGRGGGEIDLIMRQADQTLVFVEVRARKNADFGGAAASISVGKRRRIVLAAKFYLSRLRSWPPCRFDVVTVQGPRGHEVVQWLPAAFNA